METRCCQKLKFLQSIWRGLLELLQLFQSTATDVRKLWERSLICGFLGFDQAVSIFDIHHTRRSLLQAKILAEHNSAMLIHLSFVTGGTICITLKSHARNGTMSGASPTPLEPLDLKVSRV